MDEPREFSLALVVFPTTEPASESVLNVEWGRLDIVGHTLGVYGDVHPSSDAQIGHTRHHVLVCRSVVVAPFRVEREWSRSVTHSARVAVRLPCRPTGVEGDAVRLVFL